MRRTTQASGGRESGRTESWLGRAGAAVVTTASHSHATQRLRNGNLIVRAAPHWGDTFNREPGETPHTFRLESIPGKPRNAQHQ